MPKKTQHQRRVELGKWLETLLNPQVSRWDIYQLFQQAITLLDIEFQIDREHSFFLLIENIQLNENEHLSHGVRRCYEDLHNFTTVLSSIKNTNETSDPFKDGTDDLEKYELQAIDHQMKVKWEDIPQIEFKITPPTDEDKERVEYFKKYTAFFHINTDIRQQLSEEFESRHNSPPTKRPTTKQERELQRHNPLIAEPFETTTIHTWDKEHRLYEKYQEEVKNSPQLIRLDTRVLPYLALMQSTESILKFFNQVDTVSTLLKKIYEQDKPWQISIPMICKQEKLSKNSSVEYFIEAYSAISDILHIKEGILVFERTLSHRFAPIAITSATEKTYLHMVTEAFLSNILFDFLLSGGQEYYGFCEYCGKFLVIERKGRKKFCSDICRTMKQRQ